MTEAIWRQGTDPRVLLDQVRSRVSPRKLRWFACACVRAVWPWLQDPRSRRAIEVAERFADGQASSSELASAELEAFEFACLADLRTTVSDPQWAATRAAARAANLDAYSAASGAAFIAALCSAPWQFSSSGTVAHHGNEEAKHLVRKKQCEMLRDIAGNPFHPLPTLDPVLLRWDNELIHRWADAIYAEDRFEDLPLLGDALEEAGCRDDAILDHCRQSSPHVRGCWVVDLILNRS